MAVLTVVVEQTRQTALHTAAAEDSVETAELLLGARAALDVKDNVRTTCRWIHAMSDSAAGDRMGGPLSGLPQTAVTGIWLPYSIGANPLYLRRLNASAIKSGGVCEFLTELISDLQSRSESKGALYRRLSQIMWL